MVIVIKLPDENVGVMRASVNYMEKCKGMSEEEALDRLMRLCYSPGTKYEILDEHELPDDSTWRNAWEFVESSKTRVV